MIDWMQAPNFTVSEFPDGELVLAKPELIYALQDLRGAFGASIKPSPVRGSLARRYGSENSRHYAVDRLSDAIDIFPSQNPLRCWQLAVARFGGVGIYYDTTPGVMLHVDMRPQNVWWCRVEGNYYTANKTHEATSMFYQMLASLAG